MEYAARASFSRLLVPGTMALVTDLVGFGTLILLPIGMIQELAITASIGVAFKIITNLVMLWLHHTQNIMSFAMRAQSAITYRQNLMGFLKISKPKPAIITLSLVLYYSLERHIWLARDMLETYMPAPQN